MNLRDLSRDLVEYISDRSDQFTRDEAQAFRVVMARIMADVKTLEKVKEETVLRVLRNLN
jgi:NAD-specific glutamate dehydrogenase